MAHFHSYSRNPTDGDNWPRHPVYSRMVLLELRRPLQIIAATNEGKDGAAQRQYPISTVELNDACTSYQSSSMVPGLVWYKA